MSRVRSPQPAFLVLLLLQNVSSNVVRSFFLSGGEDEKPSSQDPSQVLVQP